MARFGPILSPCSYSPFLPTRISLIGGLPHSLVSVNLNSFFQSVVSSSSSSCPCPSFSEESPIILSSTTLSCPSISNGYHTFNTQSSDHFTSRPLKALTVPHLGKAVARRSVRTNSMQESTVVLDHRQWWRSQPYHAPSRRHRRETEPLPLHGRLLGAEQ